jgi:nicotinamide phosphoribosyltransferase
MEQYPEGTNKVYSYLTARSDKKIPFTVFFGLQYYLQEYLSQPITKDMVNEFLEYRQMILGNESVAVTKKMNALAELGYLPIKIKAVKEGTVMPVKNVLMTITNTHPDFYWVVGFVESILLKVWNTTTVASYSMKLRSLVNDMATKTCSNAFHTDWQVHDFGYRGCSSEETAALSGAAHLINFRGTDTVPAVKFLKEYYNGSGLIGASVPASEHSVMCSFSREDEFKAFDNMLNLYPSGIVSIVSDTYNLWNVLQNFTVTLKDKILARDGKVVFRPDSGNPELILCGDPNAVEGTPEHLGAIRILDQVFGSTVNDKGYRELNPKVGLIYGDGMYFERFERILNKMQEMGYASSNLVIGVGGLLLQQHSRDDQGFAIKATYCEIQGEPREIVKDPITDSGKKSLKGMMSLFKNEDNGEYFTVDQVTEDDEARGCLEVVFENGKILRTQTLEDIRKTAYEGV